MKKIIFGLIATVMFGNVFYGQEFTKDNYYKLHNKSLDMILNEINTKSSNYQISKNPKDDALIYLQSYLSRSTDIETKLIKNFYVDFLSQNYLNSTEYKTVINNSYYIELIKITENYSDYKLIIKEISNLLSKLENDRSLNELTKNSLKSGMLIGIESAEYWANNQTKWESVGQSFNKNNLSSKKKMNPHLAADIQGAVGGAVCAGIATAGVGALAGACLGGAWGSAASAFWSHMGW